MLQQTIEEQNRHFRWHRLRERAMTPRRLLQESDELLYWVEECMVQERRIVPGWLVSRLMVVLRHAHPDLPARLGRERRPNQVIGLFIKRRIPPYLRPEEAMDLVHEMGGLTYLPHPLDRNRSHFTPDRIVELAPHVDIIETYNPWCEPAANRAAAELAADLGKVTATGSDSHGLRELGRSWMEIEEFDGPDDFLHKLAGARHIVTSTSGTGRRA